MRNKTVHISALAAWLSAAACLSASTITFVALPHNTENGTYNGFGGVTIDGVSYSNLICDDYFDTTYFPSGPFTFNEGRVSDLSSALFASLAGIQPATAKLHYEAAAILLGGMSTNPDATAEFQYALWDLFSPSAPSYRNSNQLLINALLEAANPTSADLQFIQDLRIYSPANSHNQEFLQLSDAPMHQDSGAVPEPGTLSLLIAGAVAAGGFAVMRHRRRTN